MPWLSYTPSVQIIKNMPYSYFKPVGPAFIQKCNLKFDLQPALNVNEFGRYCFGYMVYFDVGGVHNYLHPGYYRRADRLLQVGFVIIRLKFYLREGLKKYLILSTFCGKAFYLLPPPPPHLLSTLADFIIML